MKMTVSNRTDKCFRYWQKQQNVVICFNPPVKAEDALILHPDIHKFLRREESRLNTDPAFVTLN